MRLDYFLLADWATTAERGKVNMLGAGVQHVTLAALPGQVQSLAAVARFEVEDEDQGRAHTFITTMTSPSGVEMHRLETVAGPPPPMQLQPEETVSVVFVANFVGPRFSEWGLYTVSVEVDQRPLAQARFVVRPPENSDG